MIDEFVVPTWLENLLPSQEGEVPAELGEYVFRGAERTYAVFDTASVSEGLALVEGDPGFCGSLLAGGEAEDLADVMPCLLELTPESEISRRLFREVPDHPAALGTLHLWPANPALFIRCKSSPDQLRGHLRRFMKPADSKGLRRYVRLWNPAIAFDYLRALEAPTNFLRQYLNAPNDPLTVIARKGDAAVVVRPKAPPVRGARVVLSDVDIKALTFNVKKEFHDRLVNQVIDRGNAKGQSFDKARVSKVAMQVMAAMETHKRDDVPKMKDHEKLVLVLLMMHDDATNLVLSGPVIRNPHLPWAQRVDVVAKSYLVGLLRMSGKEVT